MDMATSKNWRSNQRFRNSLVAFVLLNLPISNQTWAGPSYQDTNMEYDFPRPLKVVTKLSNGYRFEIVTPKQSEEILGQSLYGSNSSWFGDEYLIVWPPIGEAEDWPREPIYMRRLRSREIVFIENGPLSSDYVIIKEWSGGASCCSIIQAFQTKPEFKKLIEHNNDFYEDTIIPVGEHEIELHETPLSFSGSHSSLKYNARVFNLKMLEWK